MEGQAYQGQYQTSVKIARLPPTRDSNPLATASGRSGGPAG